jgi:hypothetical protein
LYPRPKYFSIVFAFAGDSTITKSAIYSNPSWLNRTIS